MASCFLCSFYTFNVLNFSTKFCFSLYSLKLYLGVDSLKINFNGLLLVAHINFIECIYISYLWKFLNNRSKCLKQKLRHFIGKGYLEWIKFCLSCIFVNKILPVWLRPYSKLSLSLLSKFINILKMLINMLETDIKFS